MLTVEASETLQAHDSRHWPGHSITYLEAAREIAHVIRGHISRARDGNIYWRHPVVPIGSFRPGLIGPHLYPGTVGIAFFFAAAARVLGEDGLSDLALQAILPLRREVQEITRNPAQARELRHPIGGLTGLGSLVYGLTRIGDLLDDSSLFEDAQAASALITPDRIAADENLDVMLGTAGTILGLLALDERLPGENLNGDTPMELAIHCAHHLVAKQRPSSNSGPAWLTPAGYSWPSGFCHGVAGMASALARLSTRVGQSAWREIAEQSLATERALYVPALRNWKTTESDGAKLFNSWCKGAPGIALGRLSMREGGGDPLLDEEISNALETAGGLALSESDDLCCGNAGRIDVLVQAYRGLGDVAWLQRARRLADGLLERARSNGFYSLKLHGEILLDLRFFPGLSGIGYVLLRLAKTDDLPCVLAME